MTTKKALVYTGNLLFRSKLSLMLQELNLSASPLSVSPVSVDGSLRDALKKDEPVIIIIDLGKNSSDCVRLIETLRSSAIGFARQILCFGPHVAKDVMLSAEKAGADLVVPNSAIFAKGVEIIGRLIADKSRS